MTQSRLRFAPLLVAPIIAVLGACTSFRVDGGAAVADAGADVTDVNPNDGSVEPASDAAASALQQVPDLPSVNYRGVVVVSRTSVFIVGDEMILEWNGTEWSRTRVGGVEFFGVYAASTHTFAVGTNKNSNTGVIWINGQASGGKWVQMDSVPHGLKAIWGSGDFRVIAGHDGVLYSGVEPTPFAQGVQIDRTEGVPDTLFSPIIAGVGGNSPALVVAAAGPGTLARFDGVGWAQLVERIDLTRSFRSVWGATGTKMDVIIGANYYGLWRYQGSKTDAGTRIPMLQLNEERDDSLRASQFINSVWGTSSDRFVAVGTSGRVMSHRHLESPKIYATPAGANDLWGIAGTGFDDLWIVGDRGVVLHGSL